MLGQGEEAGLMGWVLAGLASIVATLSTVVATLFRMNQTNVQAAHTHEIATLDERLNSLEKSNAELQQQAGQCIEDREQLRIELAVIKARLQGLEES